MERAGLTDVLVIGMLIRWINVSVKPMDNPAKSGDDALSVEPNITIKKTKVSTVSVISAGHKPYLSGDKSP